MGKKTKERRMRKFDLLDLVDRFWDEGERAKWTFGKKRNEGKTEETRAVFSPYEQLSLDLREEEPALKEKLDGYYEALAKEGSGEGPAENALREEVQAELSSLKRTSANLQRSYFTTLSFSEELETRLHDVEKSLKKRKVLPPAPANSAIDWQEQQESSFARGINFYKLFLVFFVGSFVGVVFELLWCLFTKGYLESRSGVVYGPFNPLYGAGAVLMTIALYRYRNHSSLISFGGGMLAGSALEYFCSWGQELLFGTRSWDYSELPFNLNGRICLMYSIFWGILGVLWIKNLYPRLAHLILRLPSRGGKILCWILAVLTVFNMAVTGLALARWTNRRNGIPPETALGELIDARFPDERMSRIFANMEFNE